MDATEDLVYLFGDAKIHYEDIDLKADQIIINWSKKEVFAIGTADSNGKVTGKPEFKEADQDFKASTMRYNFDSKKARSPMSAQKKVKDIFMERP